MIYLKRVFFFVVLTVNNLCAQNLVQNPSFESYQSTGCDVILSHLAFDTLADSWSVPTWGTSDIHTTLNASSCWSNALSTHFNAVGNQQPRTGTQMAGIYMYSGLISLGNPTAIDGYREYLQVPLASPLVINQSYYIEYWVSLAEGSFFYASNNFGAYFSDTLINQFTAGNWAFYGPLNFTPQINSSAVVADSIGWTKISGCFTATSAAEYLIIGNFYSDSATSNLVIRPFDTTATNLNARKYSYYYIDDVLLQPSNNVITGLSTNQDTTICEGDSVLLIAHNGVNVYWNNGVEGDSNLVSPSQTKTYIVSNALSCESDSVTITVIEAVDISISTNTTLCNSDSVFFDVDNGANYIWSNGIQNASFWAYIDSSSTFSVIENNSICPSYDTVTINVYQEVGLSTNQDTTICEGDSILLTANNGVNAFWSNNVEGDSNIVSPVETTTYIVSNTQSSCESDSVTVNIIHMIDILATPDSICGNDSVFLSIDNGSNYIWNTGVQNNSFWAYVDSTTTFSVIENGLTCTFYDTVTVIVYYPDTAISAGLNKEICFGDTVALEAINGTNYFWDNGVQNSNITVSPSTTTAYTVTDSTNSCGIQTDEVTVFVNPLPEPQIIIIQNQVLTTSLFASYQWYLNGVIIPNATNKYYTFTQNGVYTVEVTDSYGCSNFSEATIIDFVSLEQIKEIDQFKVYPNPSTGNIFITSKLHEIYQADLFNPLGELVLSYKMPNGNTELKTESLPRGMYLLRIYNESESIIYKVILN